MKEWSDQRAKADNDPSSWQVLTVGALIIRIEFWGVLIKIIV